MTSKHPPCKARHPVGRCGARRSSKCLPIIRETRLSRTEGRRVSASITRPTRAAMSCRRRTARSTWSSPTAHGRHLTAMFKIAKRVLLSWTLPALAAMASPASMAAEPAALIYRTGEEVVFEVTSNGLSRIPFQGRSLATGEWSVFNAESWFSPGGCQWQGRGDFLFGFPLQRRFTAEPK